MNRIADLSVDNGLTFHLMTHPLEQLREAALAEIAAATDEQALEAVRIRYLGRSGSISAWGEQMKSLSKEERPVVGKLLNEARNAVTACNRSERGKISDCEEGSALASIDISLPGTPHEIGAHSSPYPNARPRDRNFSPDGVRTR